MDLDYLASISESMIEHMKEMEDSCLINVESMPYRGSTQSAENNRTPGDTQC